MKSGKKQIQRNKASQEINIIVDRTSPGDEIDLHRLTVDEAIVELDHYLNRAFVSGLRTVRINHGKGTGTIKRAAIRHMKGHPLVRSIHTAWPDEGGDGVTIAELVN